MKNKVDLIILGAGPGGYTAAVEAAKKGLSVLLVEKELLGGVYLHEGCLSVKSLVACEKRYRKIQRSDDFGVTLGSMQVHASDWMNRQREVSSKIHEEWIESLKKYPKLKLLRGSARFVDPQTILVEKDRFSEKWSADQMIIATGSHPAVLPGAKIDGDSIGTSQHFVHRPSPLVP